VNRESRPSIPHLPDTHDRRWVIVAAAAVAISFLFLQVLPLWGWSEGAPRSHQNDFKHIYLGAWLLAEGESPYDAETVFAILPAFKEQDPRFRSILPYVYLPFTGQVLRPLTWLDFDKAAHAWMVTNHLLILAGMALLLAAGDRIRWPDILLLGAAVTLNATILRQNNAGQLNAVLFAGYAAVYLGMVRQWHPAAVGGLAAFLALFKLTPGILLIYFLCTRRWRLAAWMVGLGAGMALLGVVLSGIRVWLDFLPVLEDMGYGRSTWAEFGQTFWRDPTNQSLNSFLHHVLVPWEGMQPWFSSTAAVANGATMLLALVLLGVLGTALVRQCLHKCDEGAVFALVVLTSLLVPSICWDHYLLQALVPAWLLWRTAKSWPLRLLIAICVGVICLPVAFDAGVIAGWRVADATRGMGLLVMSLKLWPLMALWVVAVWKALRPGLETGPIPK
jgi:hypothetical protein